MLDPGFHVLCVPAFDSMHGGVCGRMRVHILLDLELVRSFRGL